jgi:hypothetical protein
MGHALILATCWPGANTAAPHLLQASKLTGSSSSSGAAGPGSPLWQLLQAMGARLLSRAATRVIAVPPVPAPSGQQQLAAAQQLTHLVHASLPSLQRLLYHQLGAQGYASVEVHMGQRAAALHCVVSCC